MSDGHHLITVKIKSQYLSNGLRDRREIWHDDNIGAIKFTPLAHILYTYSVT